MASIDALSGLANRRGFQSRLDFEWMRAQQYECELSLMMIDVDHFKLYNDTYGHPEGDVCLTRIGETLAGIAADTMGFAGRYGGEEFCLLLPNTDAAHALAIGETVRTAVLGLAVPHAPSSHCIVTVSVGVAEREASGDPRPSIEERYRSREEYLGRVSAAALALVRQRLLLPEDVPAVLERALAHWDWLSAGR